MSETKTLAVRLDPALHARLTLLAKLSDRSATEIIRVGIETQLDEMAKLPEIAARAADLQAELARDVEAQQAALAALVDGGASTTGTSRRSSAASK
jgi:predicted DNA-binding protein